MQIIQVGLIMKTNKELKFEGEGKELGNNINSQQGNNNQSKA